MRLLRARIKATQPDFREDVVAHHCHAILKRGGNGLKLALANALAAGLPGKSLRFLAAPRNRWLLSVETRKMLTGPARDPGPGSKSSGSISNGERNRRLLAEKLGKIRDEQQKSRPGVPVTTRGTHAPPAAKTGKTKPTPSAPVTPAPRPVLREPMRRCPHRDKGNATRFVAGKVLGGGEWGDHSFWRVVYTCRACGLTWSEEERQENG
jgi:hypothetical protein